MPRTKKTNYEKKILYQITPSVMKELDIIMKERGIKTITGAINHCVLYHRNLTDCLKNEQSDSLKLFNSKMKIEEELTKLVQFNEFLKKYTKKG